jgi:trigger factor
VDIKELKKLEVPELNLDFIQKLWPDMKSVQEFRDQVEESLRRRFQEQSEQRLHQQIIDKVSGLVDFEIPPSLVLEEQERMLAKLKNYMQAEGMDSLPESEDNSLRERIKESAAKKVKAGIIISRIAELEGIKVEEEDLNKELTRLSGGSDIGALKRDIIKNNMLASIVGRIIESKTLQHLLEAAKIIKDAPA